MKTPSSSPHSAQVNHLEKKAQSFCSKFGVALSSDLEQQNKTLLLWLSILNDSQRTGVADNLLGALTSAICESAACLVLGLVRPTLFSMRVEIDLVLSWLYFKDHPIEWAHVNNVGEGFKLKKEVFEYLGLFYPGFGERFGILRQIATRNPEDTYRLLSAHIHSQSNPVLPIAKNLADAVCDENICKQCITLSGQVAEYIGDVLFATFASTWASLPTEIITPIDNRFVSKAQREKFYGSV